MLMSYKDILLQGFGDPRLCQLSENFIKYNKVF